MVVGFDAWIGVEVEPPFVVILPSVYHDIWTAPTMGMLVPFAKPYLKKKKSVTNEDQLMEEWLTCSAAARDLKEITYASASNSADSTDSNWPVVWEKC